MTYSNAVVLSVSVYADGTAVVKMEVDNPDPPFDRVERLWGDVPPALILPLVVAKATDIIIAEVSEDPVSGDLDRVKF